MPTFSSYERDIRMYGGGFCGNGYLFMPLHHMAGTCDCLEIPLDEFEKEFTELCDCFENNDPWGGKIKSGVVKLNRFISAVHCNCKRMRANNESTEYQHDLSAGVL